MEKIKEIFRLNYRSDPIPERERQREGINNEEERE